jgi:hypothetical protein
VSPEEGLYAYNLHNIVEILFKISIAPMQSQGWSLVIKNKFYNSENGNAYKEDCQKNKDML